MVDSAEPDTGPILERAKSVIIRDAQKKCSLQYKPTFDGDNFREENSGQRGMPHKIQE